MYLGGSLWKMTLFLLLNKTRKSLQTKIFKKLCTHRIIAAFTGGENFAQTGKPLHRSEATARMNSRRGCWLDPRQRDPSAPDDQNTHYRCIDSSYRRLSLVVWGCQASFWRGNQPIERSAFRVTILGSEYQNFPWAGFGTGREMMKSCTFAFGRLQNLHVRRLELILLYSGLYKNYPTEIY